MKATKFDEANVTYAENQEEYNDLPAHRSAGGDVTSCWELSEEELAEINKTKKVWLTVKTFNHPLQPLRIQITKPEMDGTD